MFFYNESDSEVSIVQPTIGDPYFYNTSLLLKMDNDFSDSSINQATTSGNAPISTTESKYGGGSGHFSNKNLSISNVNQSTYFAAGEDFTIEMWVNMQSHANWGGFMSHYHQGLNILFYDNTNKVFFQHLNNSSTSTFGLVSSIPLPMNQWVHLAFVRTNGNTISMYFDGQQVATGTHSGYVGSNAGMRLGLERNNGAYVNGYIDDLRITKNIARYTANFTPPDSHPTTGPSEIVTAGMVLELDAEDYETVGYNGGTKTSAGNDPVYVGTDEKYFQFNGAGHISWPSNPDYAFGTGAFTVEFWTEGYISRLVQVDNTIDNSDSSIWWVGTNPSYGAMINRHATASTGIRSDASVDYNNWVHTIVVREAGNNRIYANGQLQTITISNIDGVSFGQSGMIIGAGSANTFSSGKIAAVRLFNRSLTEAEALQNFNATKSRFGL